MTPQPVRRSSLGFLQRTSLDAGVFLAIPRQTSSPKKHATTCTGLEFHCRMNPECYMTGGSISIFANAAAGGSPRAYRLVSTPQAARPLLQSRGCSKEIAAWHAVVETLAKRFYVSGAVQGVGFRFFAERAAAQLGVAGYVKNLFDGRVEVYAIGSVAQLNELKSELRRGPRMASVDQVAENDAEILPEFSHAFSIERDY